MRRGDLDEGGVEPPHSKVLRTSATTRAGEAMRMSLRLIFSLVVGVTLLSFLIALFQVKAERRGLRHELESHAAIVADSLKGKVEPLLTFHYYKRIQAVVNDFGDSEHLKGIAIFNKS